MFERRQAGILGDRLREPRRFVQVVAGARQVGKSTLVTQVLSRLEAPNVFVSADEPTLSDTAWLAAQWERARLAATAAGPTGAVLALDEVQKIPRWSETVKRLWDEDTRARRPLKVVVLGSAPLLLQHGAHGESGGSIRGRAPPALVVHRDARGLPIHPRAVSLLRWLPGAASLVDDPSRWRRYVLDALVETTIARDVLLMTRVDKPVLLRRLFELGCRSSGQVLSYTKMLGQLQDAGNTTTLAHYLDLLSGAGMLTGLQKFAGKAVRQRGSSPKFQVFNTALMSALSGVSPDEARDDRAYRGRLVESAVGAHVANAAASGVCEVFYWRDTNREVDFVVRAGRVVVAIEVKSGRVPDTLPGLAAFTEAFRPTRTLIVGGDGVPLDEFLATPVEHWLQR